MGKTIIPGGGPNDRAVLQGFQLYPGIVGDTKFVNATGGSSTGPGWAPENAYATLQQAHDSLTATNGDTILLMPGHTETIVGPAGWTISKAGVSIIGLGVGRARAKFTYGTLITAQTIVSGANVLFKNIVFDFTGLDAITAAMSVTGADVAFEDCEFITNVAAAGCVLGILTAATATRFRVERCRFLGTAANSGTTTTAHIQHEVGDDFLIKDSYFTGKLTQSILNVTNTVLRGLIDNNRFVIATGTVGIAMKSTSTPFITNNRFNMPSGTTPIVAAAGFVAGNVYSAAAGVTAGTASTI